MILQMVFTNAYNFDREFFAIFGTTINALVFILRSNFPKNAS